MRAVALFPVLLEVFTIPNSYLSLNHSWEKRSFSTHVSDNFSYPETSPKKSEELIHWVLGIGIEWVRQHWWLRKYLRKCWCRYGRMILMFSYFNYQLTNQLSPVQASKWHKSDQKIYAHFLDSLHNTTLCGHGASFIITLGQKLTLNDILWLPFNWNSNKSRWGRSCYCLLHLIFE